MSLALALLLAAAGPTRITGPADVVQLCRHLTGLVDTPPSADPVVRAVQFQSAAKAKDEALDREYELLVPPREFGFGEYDPQGELLDVGTHLAAGHGLLDLEPNDVALQLNAGPDEASAAYKLWSQGKGALRVTFDLDDTTTCDGSPSSPPWLLMVHLISISFIDDAGHLLLDGANGLAANDHPRLDHPAGIAVQAVVTLEGKVDAARVATSVQGTAGLQRCYSTALGANPELEGTVVFQAKIDAKGRTSTLQVAMEDLGHPDLVGCLGDSLREVTLAGVSPGAQLLVPLELRRM